jgi:hypothetical protein
MSVVQEFPAAPSEVYALITDRGFLEGRLADCGGEDPEIVSLEVGDGTATVTTRSAIPASVLPPMVASMMAGNPVTERTENWRADGDGYSADFSVTVKGAPASLKGTMTLAPAPDGSTLTVQGNAAVPIPMFGGKIEEVIASQIGELLQMEGDYTRAQLAG